MARANAHRRRHHKGKHHRRRRRSGFMHMLGLNPRNAIIRNADGSIIRNPFIREVRMAGNPRRRRRHHRRRNPSIIRNPSGSGAAPTLGGVMKNPMQTVTQGFVAVASAYMTNSIPNMFGLFPGVDMVSKLLRGVIRVLTGTFVFGAARSIAPRYANAAAVGAAMGSVGATVLDLLNTRLVLGYGDVTQTPGMIFAGVGSIFGPTTTTPTGTAGYAGHGAYTRPMGRLNAYTRPMGGYNGMGAVYMPGTTGMVHHSVY